jgi:hypothetical protein
LLLSRQNGVSVTFSLFLFVIKIIYVGRTIASLGEAVFMLHERVVLTTPEKKEKATLAPPIGVTTS